MFLAPPPQPANAERVLSALVRNAGRLPLKGKARMPGLRRGLYSAENSDRQGEVDLQRFCSGLLRAMLAIKETGYGSDT